MVVRRPDGRLAAAGLGTAGGGLFAAGACADSDIAPAFTFGSPIAFGDSLPKRPWGAKTFNTSKLPKEPVGAL
jgi:hypothetical protein